MQSKAIVNQSQRIPPHEIEALVKAHSFSAKQPVEIVTMMTSSDVKMTSSVPHEADAEAYVSQQIADLNNANEERPQGGERLLKHIAYTFPFRSSDLFLAPPKKESVYALNVGSESPYVASPQLSSSSAYASAPLAPSSSPYASPQGISLSPEKVPRKKIFLTFTAE